MDLSLLLDPIGFLLRRWLGRRVVKLGLGKIVRDPAKGDWFHVQLAWPDYPYAWMRWIAGDAPVVTCTAEMRVGGIGAFRCLWGAGGGAQSKTQTIPRGGAYEIAIAYRWPLASGMNGDARVHAAADSEGFRADPLARLGPGNYQFDVTVLHGQRALVTRAFMLRVPADSSLPVELVITAKEVSGEARR